MGMTISKMESWFEKEGPFDVQISRLIDIHNALPESQRKMFRAMLVAVQQAFAAGPKYSTAVALAVAGKLDAMREEEAKRKNAMNN